MNLDIIPSPGLFDKEWKAIEEKIKVIQSFSSVIHIDFLDGKFAKDTSWMDFSSFHPDTKNMLFEAHLMVDNPVQYIKPLAASGFKRYIGQIELMPDPTEFIATGEEIGEVGLAIDAKTPVSKLTVSLEDLDCLLIMTVHAGASGQAFLPECLQKVRDIREKSFDLPIEVDGGINKESIVWAKKAGATRAVVTGALFKEGNPKENYTNLLKQIAE